MKSVKNIITIDGPGGVGKGTLAYRLSRELNWKILDSGLIYRLVGYISLKVGNENPKILSKHLKEAEIDFIINTSEKRVDISFNSENITSFLRDESIAKKASVVSKNRYIRESVLDIQRNTYDKKKGLVADGRDMGTIIFPEAGLKIFLDASLEIRAERRANQLIERGMSVIMHDLLEAIKLRDKEDRQRKHSPLIMAKDAEFIDTSSMSEDEVFSKVMELYKK